MSPALTHASLMALDLPELRRRMVAHREARPGDPFAAEMAQWLEDKAALVLAIECQEGELASPPFLITVPPQPMEGIRTQPELDFRRLTHRTPAQPAEAPMIPVPPPERLAQMLARLTKNETDQNDAAAYTTRADIRRFCATKGLLVPAAAQKRDPVAAKQAKAQARVQNPPSTPTPTPATAPPASASPAASVAHGAEPPRAQSAAHRPAPGADRSAAPTLSPMARVIGSSFGLPPEEIDREIHPSPAARIRALRSQALEILPELEDLSPEALSQVRDELEVLAETLALGVTLLTRRTA